MSEGTLVATTADRPAATLSPRVLVLITQPGVVLAPYDDHPALPLAAAHLVALERLVRGEGGDPPDAAAEGEVGEALAARALFANGSAGHAAALDGVEDSRREADTPNADDQLLLDVPLAFRLTSDGFQQHDHHGRLRASLSGRDLAAAGELRWPRRLAEAYEQHQKEAGDLAIDEGRFAAVVRELIAAELVHIVDPDDPNGPSAVMAQFREAWRTSMRVRARRDREAREHAAAERARAEATGVGRFAVHPVQTDWTQPQLALGMLSAYASAYDDGRLTQHYDFRSGWVSQTLPITELAEEPGVFLFSNYVWSHTQNLEHSAAVKQRNPASLTIHGGPDTPKYEGDVEAYFAANPHIDVAVRGEGEVTLVELLDALAGCLGDGSPDLSSLRDVPGLSYRTPDGVVRTPDRERVTDLDVLPSPYLLGLFDDDPPGGAPERLPIHTAIIESNRGCPYGCTFCDWGSATLSRIRLFDLERVFAEMEWCCRHQVGIIAIADANFGILDRDVAIAERLAELKAQYGFPTLALMNYAKNGVRHLRRIAEVLADADVLTMGLIAFQTMDPLVLKAIHRTNIKQEKYEELAGVFSDLGLPLHTDVMMGLPGATRASFRVDLQACIDRELHAKVNPTQLLINSPMNEPAYRAEHGIDTKPGLLVTSTSSYTRAEWDLMMDLRRVYLLGERYGVLRQVATYARHELGLMEIDCLEGLRATVRADIDRWPTIALMVQSTPECMVAPGSWHPFIAELRNYLTVVLGLADDSALDTVLRVQHALLPAWQRSFPLEVALDHDYAAWHGAVITAKLGDHQADWPDVVPSLRSFGPGTLTVEDHDRVCRHGVGNSVSTAQIKAGWELDSEVARPKVRMTGF